MYVVVVVGETEGLLKVDVKPTGDDVQEYVVPATFAAPMVVETPIHTAVLDPAFAAGNGFTVMIT